MPFKVTRRYVDRDKYGEPFQDMDGLFYNESLDSMFDACVSITRWKPDSRVFITFDDIWRGEVEFKNISIEISIEMLEKEVGRMCHGSV